MIFNSNNNNSWPPRKVDLINALKRQRLTGLSRRKGERETVITGGKIDLDNTQS
jgi:hypothetical protein